MTTTHWFTRPEFGFCRALAGHRWSLIRRGFTVERGAVVVKLHCDNCEAVRTDHIHAGSGAVQARSYEYPKGYQFELKKNELERPDKAVLRHEYVTFLRGQVFKRRNGNGHGQRRSA